VAVTVAKAGVLTTFVVTVNVAVVLPAATVTDTGTLATEALLLDRFTTIPPLGAACVSMTVAVDDVLPTTVVGLRASEATAGTGVMVRLEETVLPAYVADMTTFVVVVTIVVFTVNGADVAPCGTVMVGETNVVTEGLLVTSVTCAPPLGAGPFRLTVPVEEVPPTTVEGFKATEAILIPDVAV
jgi:hypothetical protein